MTGLEPELFPPDRQPPLGGGDPTASDDDTELTRRLTKAGEIIGIEVLDHITVGVGGYLS